MHLGQLGLWTSSLAKLDPVSIGQAAAELEALGFSAVWIPESTWADPFTVATLVLASTKSLVAATGIANVYARTPQAMSNAASALWGWYPDRFILGLGVSHRFTVEDRMGGDYTSPLGHMRTYLRALDEARFDGRAGPGTRVLAALGPKMIDTARELTDGIHPYTSTVDHTASARVRLGTGPLLVPEVKVVLESDPDLARAIAKRALPLRLPNYANNLVRSGFDPDAVARCDDEVIDALVAWGRDDRIRAHLQAHLDAGANQVAVQLLTHDNAPAPRGQWKHLAALFAE